MTPPSPALFRSPNSTIERAFEALTALSCARAVTAQDRR